MVQNELTHYGILGMKWGVRRNSAQLGKAKGKRSTEDVHDDYKKAHSSKSAKSMSNQELREANNRLQMEQQYEQLTKKRTSAGKKFVTGVIIAAGTSVATKYATQYMNKGVEKVIDAVMNRPLPVL